MSTDLGIPAERIHVVGNTVIDALLMTVLGGAGTLIGGAIGSAIASDSRAHPSPRAPKPMPACATPPRCPSSSTRS